MFQSGIPEQLQQAKAAAKAGTPQSATVREFLEWFGVKRRGRWVVRQIRQVLREAGLQTVPDFEGEFIDGKFRLVDATWDGQPPPPSIVPTESEAEEEEEESSDSGVELRTPVEPAHRLSRLAAANRPPVSVKPTDSIKMAVTLMMSHDFSQLPVMQSDWNLKGIVSWRSIGQRLAMGCRCETVQDCIEKHYMLESESSMFEAVRLIAQHDCVLVRDSHDNRITGLVTGADISEQFRVLAEPFLLLGDIENGIRELIDPHFTPEQLASIRDPEDDERIVEDVSDLTFGEYIRLLENEDRWKKLGLAIDRREFIKQLDRIREIRNDVMHFDTDVDEDALAELQHFSRFLSTLKELTGANAR